MGGGPGLSTGCKQAFGGPKRTNADVTKQYESVRAKYDKDRTGKTPKFAKSPDSPAMIKSAENQNARDAAKAEYKAAMEAKYQAAKAEEAARRRRLWRRGSAPGREGGCCQLSQADELRTVGRMFERPC